MTQLPADLVVANLASRAGSTRSSNVVESEKATTATDNAAMVRSQ